jgi:hypothetical protein
VSALVAGCEARAPKEAEGRDVVRPHLGFAIDVPQGWTFRDLYGDVVLEIYPQGSRGGSGPEGAAAQTAAPAKAAPAAVTGRAPTPARPVVQVVAIDREGIALGDWADQAVKDSKEFQADLEVTDRKPVRLADGREALRLALKNPRGIQPLVQQMLLAVTDRRAYAVLATAPESDRPAAEAAFDKCFNSFVVW